MGTPTESALADKLARGVARWRRVPPQTRASGLLVIVSVLGAIPIANAIGGLLSEARPPYALLAAVAATTLLADVLRLKVRLRHRTHSYSWAPAHLLVALTLVPTDVLLVASLAVGVGLAVTRRPYLKIAYGTGAHALGVALAAAVAGWAGLAGWADPLRSALALTAATAVFAGWSALAATLPLAMVHRTPVRTALRRSSRRRRITYLANVALGLAVLAVAQLSTPVLVALPPLLALAYAAYRAYLRVRQDRDVWRHLEETGQEISRLDEREVAQVAVTRAASLFAASEVELHLFAPDGAVRYVGDARGIHATEHVTAQDTRNRLALATYRTIDDLAPEAALEETCVHVPLTGTDGQLGLLLVRFAGRADLARRHHQLLRTFGHTVSSSVQNARLYSAMRDSARRHETAALHDALTGLPNRVLLRERVDAALATGKAFALLVIDLDHFKQVNDNLGHAAGDALLKEVAGRLTRGVRPHDTVCRLGGDEFAVLLADAAAAEPTAARLRELMCEPTTIDGEPVAVGGSVGIASYPTDGRDLDELLRHADAEMYRAKTARRSLLSVGTGRIRRAPIDLTAI